MAKPNWDLRIFRECSLLEVIATELISAGTPVEDEHGTTWLDRDGMPARSDRARGSIYLLIRRCVDALGLSSTVLLTHATRSLWEEIGIWIDIRNTVAHEGSWTPPPLPTGKPARRQRVVDAFELAGRGDGLGAGWTRYADACSAGAEVVLRSAALGNLGKSVSTAD